MTDSLSKRRLKTWIRLLRATRLVEADLREFLRVEHATTLPRFDVMAALHRAEGRLTMGELSRRLLVSNGNTTAVVHRLEHDGLVERCVEPADRRVVTVRLTAAGSRWFEELATQHEARVDAMLGRLGRRDLDSLDDLLHRLETAQLGTWEDVG